MSRKITIIGAGNVGATIAYTLSQEHLASEIVLIDIDKQKLLGEVMDIAQGTGFRDPISIVAGEYEDAKDSDIVIITSGVARKPGQTRIELVQTNVDIIKDITPKIVSQAPDALYIIVSNPVDIITYVFTRISGLPERQVIGSGTLLDTTRLRSTLADFFNVSQKNIHAYVFGEHGDSSFVPWSRCEVSGSEFDAYVDLMYSQGKIATRPNKIEITEQIHTSGSRIIANKGATYYAVSVAICRICSMLLAAYDSIVTVSSMMHGEYGIDDVCISTLSLMGPKGIVGKVPVKLTKYEIAQLQASANKLKDVIAQIKI